MNNTSTNSNIERIVMRRVNTIHALRPFVSGGALALVVFVFALWGIGREVWVAHVFQNAPSIADVSASVSFWIAAFSDTRAPVQALSVAAFAALVWFFRDLVRAAPRTFAFSRA
jgi:hypothetical protein